VRDDDASAPYHRYTLRQDAPLVLPPRDALIPKEAAVPRYRLYGRPGWGSVIVEAQLDALELPFDYDEVPNLFESEDGRRELARVNPIAQVPTLVLPDGTVMTESAAITLYLAETTGRSDFVPPAGDPSRPAFLRWLVFIVANVYPTFTYADDPTRFVRGNEAAAKAFGEAVDEYRTRLWRMVEPAVGAPWFLGERFSALDVYAATMTHWRPGRRWFDEHTPKLAAVARRAADDPRLVPACKRNFPKDYAPAA
jgi:GST-like protein